MVAIIYVVMGTTGEYSDREEWPVRAYFSKHLAEDCINGLNKTAKKLAAMKGEYYAQTGYFLYDVPLGDGDGQTVTGDSTQSGA